MLNGCSTACASKLHNLSEADIWVTSQHFKRLGSKQQRQWILDYLHLNTPQADKTATVHMLCGKTVCLQVWLAVLELSMSRYYEVRRLFLEGAHQIEGPANLKSHQTKSCEALAWMNSYFERMKEDLQGRDVLAISQSQFYTLWKQQYSHVTIPKVCHHCLLLH